MCHSDEWYNGRRGFMDTIKKLEILSQDSQYDLACACGTRDNDRRRRGQDGRWLYPVALPQGGYSVLLKTLLSNACVNDCKYCPLRCEANVRRCMLEPEEVARVFLDYVQRKKVFGLFLSSSVMRSPDYTMEKITAVARILRYKHRFKGYIHLKVIPGASDAAIEDSLSLATAVSLNIETPGKRHNDILSGKKNYENDILRPLRLMGRLTGKGSKFSRVKCTSQFIVGASDETDREIITGMSDLYGRMNFKRVYFSSYQRGLGAPDIPGERLFGPDPEQMFLREHRLYQVDFLFRQYGFRAEEIPLQQNGHLSLYKDPKEVWAEMHPAFYPVRINTADREVLLRVPGLGPETVKKILKIRRERKITHPNAFAVAGKRQEKMKHYIIYE